jgi:molecular chaperone DnaK
VDRLSGDLKSRLDAAVEGGKQALRTGDADGIKRALDELNSAYSAAGASLYQSAQSTAGAGEPSAQAAGETSKAKEDVVEADYEIVDDSKK